jgi:predicted chitinase
LVQVFDGQSRTMKIQEIILEGGWASAKTQGTKITPQTLSDVVQYLSTELEPRINQYFQDRGVPKIRFGRPVGSGSYYKKHLASDPDKTYGDIDIQFIIPQIKGETKSSNQSYFYNAIKQYGDQSGAYETESGKNIVIPLGQNQYVQVDLVAIFEDFLDWNDIFTPPEGVKGVLSSSLYSALAQALDISISDVGVQVKTANGVIVPFSKQKGVELSTISADPRTWALDIAKYLGSSIIDPVLQQFPGLGSETSLKQITASIIGIARTLEQSNRLSVVGYTSAADLLESVKNLYLEKIRKVVESSKFDKAATPEAQQLAQQTKELLMSKSQAIAATLTPTLSEGVGRAVKNAAVAGAIGLGILGYNNELPLPRKPDWLPDRPDVAQQRAQEPKKAVVPLPPNSEIYKPRLRHDAVMQFARSLEPHSQRDILIDRAIRAGLRGSELAQFLAQTHHESGGFEKMFEMGSQRDITRKYDPRFNPETAKILGNTRAGDGWRFRGRGYIQLTGRYNYNQASRDLGYDLINNPDLAADPYIAAEIAVWYWETRVRPKVRNFNNTQEVTKPINSNLRGLGQRNSLFKYYQGPQA